MQGSGLHKTKMTLFIFLALALAVLSFHGVLDEFAHESVVRTTNESIALFAVSRGINAAVSFFQEVEIPFLNVPVGEFLDPLNDAVERLSSVMVWAIGSLFLQRVALEVSSSVVSKWSFLAIAFVSVTTIVLGTWQRFRQLFEKWQRFRELSVRLFIYLAVIRFIVPVFAIIGFLVSHLLFDAEINKSKEELSSFSEEISVIDSTPAPGTQNIEEEQALKTSELDELRERRARYTQEDDALDTRIHELRGGAGLLRYLPESLGGVPADERRLLAPSGFPELDKLLSMHVRTHGLLTEEDEALDARIQELREEVGLHRYLPESLGGLSSDERQAFRPSGSPELDELLESIASYMHQAKNLDSRIQELRDEAGILRLLPERLGGVPPGEELEAAEARLEEINLEVEAIHSRGLAIETELLASAETRREEISRELENTKDRIRAVEQEMFASAETRREEIRREMEPINSQIRVAEEELECIEKRRNGEDCLSFLGKFSAMGGEGYTRVKELIGRAGDVVTTIVKLTIVVVAKNILLPLAFLIIAIKYTLPIAKHWARLTSDFRRDVTELGNTPSQKAGSPLLKGTSEDT